MSNVPKLRFKEFNGAWAVAPLSKVADINPKSGELPDNFIYIDLESVKSGMMVKRELVAKDNAPSRAQRLLKNDDILFQMVRPYQRNNFHFKLGNGYVASTGYAQIRSNGCSYFLFQKLLTNRFVSDVLVRCTGTSYPAINSNDLSSIDVAYPCLTEQQKIADFLTDIDTKIEQLTRKEELLKQYKKGVMQKIFSQEIRFKAGDGSEFPDWKEKKLGDLCEITTGKLDANAMVDSGQYRFYTCAKEYYNIDDYAFDTDALIVSGNGANVGYIHHYQGKFNAYQRTYVLDSFTDNIIFVKFVLDEYLHKRIMKEKNEGNTPYIVMGTLTDMKINLPSFSEQTKIANFLSAIDAKIDLVNTQIENTQQFKKGLLQKMFV